jgi:aminocarboxymuconate-semialdehyde decarboxylase
MASPIASAGRADLVVDLHAHFMPPDLPDLAVGTGDPRWPLLRIDSGGTGRVWRGEELFRVVRRPCWDSAARIEEMDRLGVDVQVISPIPVGLTYWAPPRPALAYARHMNDWVATAVADSDGRLRGLGTLPLQDPELAIAELTRIATDLGLAGIEMGTVVGDAELDAPELRPIFAAAADLDIPLFIHPMDVGAVPRARSVNFGFGIGMLADTALAAAALVFGGVLREFPRLRICLAHGGGAFPWTLPRLVFGRGLSDDTAASVWSETTQQLYVDSLVFDPSQIPLLIARFGADHVAAGSDYPFLPEGPAPHDVIDEAVALGILTVDNARAMKGTNALEFLDGPRGEQELR